ncbi:MAG: hypothetical protein AB4372_22395 [Xenococcus sp. (in: cyanobacteria)]
MNSENNTNSNNTNDNDNDANPIVIVIMLLWFIGLFSVAVMGSEKAFLYVFTVGAWALDALFIKKSYRENYLIIYPDLSFVCIISYSSSIVSKIEDNKISLDQQFFPYFLALIFLISIWNANFFISNNYQGRFGKGTCYLFAFLSVVFLIAGFEIMEKLVT